MLATESLDAVFDNLPPFARDDELVLAAQRGSAIFTTKPLGLRLEPVRRTLAAIEAAGVINSVGYMFRYSGITDYVQHLLHDRPLALLIGQAFTSMPGGWLSQEALTGGQIVEMSTHIVDLARYLAGDVRSVYALGRASHLPDQVDYEAASTVCLDFAGGAIGTIVSAWAAPHLFWGCTVVGPDLHLDLVYDAWTVRGTVDGRPVDYHSPLTGYPEQVGSFVRAVQTGNQSLIRCSYRDGAITLATTLAATRSLVTGQSEEVKL
jgi:predicted dehydrogenase